MRSVFFQRPLEYQIETSGEEWNQGDSLSGTLRVRNNGGDSLSTQAVQILLAYALKKELKDGKADAWQVRETLNFDLPELDAGAQHTAEWTLPLPSDCPLTDKSGTLFLLFGGTEVLENGGRIDLQVRLHPLLQSFLQTFTTQFKFLEKHRKHVKGWAEAKLNPPDTQEYSSLDHLLCHLRVREEQLEVRHFFKVKVFSREENYVKMRRKTRELEQSLSPEDYLQTGGFPNRNYFRKRIDEALEIVRNSIL
jgi:hypothetical protein